MSKDTDLLNQHLTAFLTDIHNYRSRILELEESVKALKKEISHQKSLANKHLAEKNELKKKLDALKTSKSKPRKKQGDERRVQSQSPSGEDRGVS